MKPQRKFNIVCEIKPYLRTVMGTPLKINGIDCFIFDQTGLFGGPWGLIKWNVSMVENGGRIAIDNNKKKALSKARVRLLCAKNTAAFTERLEQIKKQIEAMGIKYPVNK